MRQFARANLCVGMKSIVLLFWRLCLLQTGPDAVPASNVLTAVVVCVNAAINISVQLLLMTDSANLLRATSLSFVGLACTAALVAGSMRLMGRQARTQQTLTAIFGTDVITTIFTSLAFVASGFAGQTIALFGITLLTLWSLMIFGFILHRALEIRLGFGVAMALFVVIFSVAVTQTAVSS